MYRYIRLRQLRVDRKLTHKQLASILGVKPDKYSRCERGEQDIPASMLVALSRFYKVSTDYILDMADSPKRWCDRN